MALPKTWTEGEVLTAQDLNTNMTNLDGRVAALEASDDGYDVGQGGGSVGTTPTVPTDSAAVTLAAGTYDVEYRMALTLSVSSARQFSLGLYDGTTDLDTAEHQQALTGGSFRGNLSGKVRVTLTGQKTLSLRCTATATGGTQGMATNAIWARRVI